MERLQGGMLGMFYTALLALLIIGYVSIDLVVRLPVFLYYENIVLAILYAYALILHAVRSRAAYIYAMVLAGFNAGRVSRSIVSPTGSLGRLAVEHIPLLTLILVVAVIAAILEYRRA